MPPGSETKSRQAPSGGVLPALDRAIRVILGLLLLGMVGLNVASALGRYLFGYVITGADEILVFSMIWIVMVGLIVVTADRDNIALDIVPGAVSPRARSIISIFNHVVMSAACAAAAFHSWSFVARVTAIGQKSMALGLPMTVPHAALVTGFAGCAIVSALIVVRDLMQLLGPSSSLRRKAV